MTRLRSAKHLLRLYVMAASLSASAVGAGENQLFSQTCRSCHTGGVKGWISGAPNVNKKQHWDERLQQDSPEILKEVVLLGLRDHKVKGGCSRCSDEDVSGAVDYMLGLVKQQ